MNIENKLDLFFQRLEHTPGPWKFEDEYVRANSLNNSEEGNMVADIYTRPSSKYEDEMDANSKLITSSPSMLRTLCRTYLWMLLYLPMEVRATVHGQSMLSDLRHAISEATNIDGQQVQDEFEGYAHELNAN